MPIDIADPSRLPKDFSIFFCWQDHLDKKLHRFLIRDALNAAIGKVQAELPENSECVLRQDSDTMNRAGSVDIANSILQKISQSVVVVGDVTPVLHDVIKDIHYPNPNVMIEIGYAAKAIGWSRIICLFNEACGSPENLPFDIRHRRLTPYSCKDSSQKMLAAKTLEGTLYNSLRAIIQEIGRGEFDAALGNEVVKRERDLRLLRQILSTIHRPTLDRFIESGINYQFFDECNFFISGFEATVCSSTFRFYDKEVEHLAVDLYKVWAETFTHSGNVFFSGNRPGSYVLKPDHDWDQGYRQTVGQMISAYKRLKVALKAFLDHVHTHYPEIEMVETDDRAWETKASFLKENFPAKISENPSVGVANNS